MQKVEITDLSFSATCWFVDGNWRELIRYDAAIQNGRIAIIRKVHVFVVVSGKEIFSSLRHSRIL